MDLYHTTDAHGISMLNPNKEAMRELLTQLDEAVAEDAEHPDVSLIHDASGWTLSVFPSGTVTLENLDGEDTPPPYINCISRSDALKMWLELSRGEIKKIRSYPWIMEEA